MQDSNPERTRRRANLLNIYAYTDNIHIFSHMMLVRQISSELIHDW
jgi:hypothetical protein